MENREEFISGLRELADWLEATPEAPISSYGYATNELYVCGKKKDEVVALAATPGEFRKDYQGSYFKLIRTFSGGVSYSLTAERSEVCEAVVVGQETVVEKNYDLCPTHEVTRDVVEWKCHPLLEG